VGVITMNGGSTSHAAVVARSMNRCCIVGVGHEPHNFMVEKISMDGSTGRIWFEEVPVIGGACKDAEILRIASTRQGSVIMTNVPTQHYPAIC
ncbi:PEP-utilizing enzyme, partial [Streptococcus pyogenes]